MFVDNPSPVQGWHRTGIINTPILLWPVCTGGPGARGKAKRCNPWRRKTHGASCAADLSVAGAGGEAPQPTPCSISRAEDRQELCTRAPHSPGRVVSNAPELTRTPPLLSQKWDHLPSVPYAKTHAEQRYRLHCVFAQIRVLGGNSTKLAHRSAEPQGLHTLTKTLLTTFWSDHRVIRAPSGYIPALFGYACWPGAVFVVSNWVGGRDLPLPPLPFSSLP